MSLEALLAEIRACRICRDAPRYGAPLPHEPHPVLQVAAGARICIVAQAPGNKVNLSGRPFTDPSGDRLRQWLGVAPAAFYDPARFAIMGTGFCFPGNDAAGGDLPPRRECAELWQARLFAEIHGIELMLLIGQYAQRWYLDPTVLRGGVSAIVGRWREVFEASKSPRMLPLPHPSWRNTAWLRRNPWFEAELVPVLRAEVARLIR